MSKVLTVVCPWCNIKQKTELKGMHHIQSTDDYHEFLCKSCGRPFTIEKVWLRTKIRSSYMNDNK